MLETTRVSNLLKKISKNNDEEAFRNFFDLYYARLFRWAGYWVSFEPMAEEVVSDVFVKIWKNRKNIPQISDIDSYLFVATKRQALNYLRQQDKKQEACRSADFEITRYTSSPDEECMHDELKEAVSKAVTKLPDRCRLVFELVRFEGMKYQEVANHLSISPKTVENHLLKATSSIRECIREYREQDDLKFYLKQIARTLALPLLVSLFYLS